MALHVVVDSYCLAAQQMQGEAGDKNLMQCSAQYSLSRKAIQTHHIVQNHKLTTHVSELAIHTLNCAISSSYTRATYMYARATTACRLGL